MSALGSIYRQLFTPSVREIIMGITNPVEFIAPKSKWTKANIAKEINDLLDTHYNIPLKENMITDEQAQDFTVKHYQWLCDCISRSEEENLSAEETWQTEWYMHVSRCFFMDENLFPQGMV